MSRGKDSSSMSDTPGPTSWVAHIDVEFDADSEEEAAEWVRGRTVELFDRDEVHAIESDTWPGALSEPEEPQRAVCSECGREDDPRRATCLDCGGQMQSVEQL